METHRDHPGRFPLTPPEANGTCQPRVDPWPGTSAHPLARNIQLVLWGGMTLLMTLSGGPGGGIGMLILGGLYALGYLFPTRWLIGGIPLLGIVGVAIYKSMAESIKQRPGSDGWDMLGLFLFFFLILSVLSTIWCGAVVGALVTRGDRKRQSPVAERDKGASDW